MAVVEIVTGLIDLLDKNLVAKSNLVSSALTGEILVNVENSFHFDAGQEVILIDYGYNDSTSPHYNVYEYAVVQNVNNTHWMTLTTPIQDPNGGWMTSKGAFIQKTIGHAPLYSGNILYGDRSVIPTTEMAITVEPLSLSNEWISIQGGLSEEYRVSIMIYGKDIDTEEGMKILNKYADATYQLLNQNIHIDLNNYTVPILADVAANTNSVIISDTVTNRQNFLPSPQVALPYCYEIQDNKGVEIDLYLVSVDSTTLAGKLILTLNIGDPYEVGINPLQRAYKLSEYATITHHGIYMYDSRTDSVDYGQVQKGSAYIRAAKLNWFGKTVTTYGFPQKSRRIDYFPEQTP